MKILIDNIYAHIEYEENQQFIKYFENKINEYINPLDPNRFRNISFRRHIWDGRVPLYDDKNKRLRVGLLYKLQQLIQQVTKENPNLRVSYVDLRESPIKPDIDERIKVDRPEGKSTVYLYEAEDNPRSYQYVSIKNAFEEQRYVVNAATNSGKTNIGIGIAMEGLKELSPDEKIFFVCESKQIFYQSHANFEAALHQPIGLWGDGKCDIQQVTCVMIGTVARALKDPRKTVKLTGAKNTMIKHFAEDYVPKFKDVPNVKQAIKSYIRTHKPKYSYDETIHETLATMVSDPHMNNDKIHKALDWYVTKFDSLIRSKAQKAFDKYQEALDVIKDVKICITDECLIAGTQVLLNDKTTKSIDELVVGDNLYGNNKVTHLIKKDKQPIMRVEHSLGYLEGSLTHPVAVYTGNGVVYKTLMQLEVGDQLMVAKTNKSIEVPAKDDNYYLARLYGMLVADGTFLNNKYKDHYNRSNTIRVNVSRDFDWYRDVMIKGISAFNNLYHGNVDYVDKLDSRGNLLLRITNKCFADYAESLGLIAGKKSNKISTPKEYLGKDSLMIPFIEGIISCEGGITTNKGVSPRLLSDMSSEKLQEEILAWLVQHGIYATTLVRPRRGNHQNIYRISISGSNLVNFYNTFDIMERKVVSIMGAPNSNSRLSSIDDYYLSPIKNVEVTDKELPVYDITTENHTFIANNVLNHNCHHAVSNSYQEVYAMLDNTRMWVGLSGTIPSEKEPVKRSKFEGIFGNKIYKISNKYLIDNEISAKPVIKFISVNSPSNDVLNIKAEQMLHAGGAVIPKNQKDLLLYQSVYRLGITENEYRNNLIANLAHKLRLSKTGTSLIVVNSLEHGDIIKGILEELGEEVYYLKGEDSTEERNKVLAKVRSGEAKILIGTTILDEGMDLPNLKYLIYASAGKSPRQVLQRVGRVLRISPEKKDTVIFDFMDRTHRLLFNQSKTRLKVYREEQFEIQE